MPFYRLFLGEGSPTKIDNGKKGTRILTSLLGQKSDCQPVGWLSGEVITHFPSSWIVTFLGLPFLGEPKVERLSRANPRVRK